MAGSPPQLDLFDYKPKLDELDGQPCPDELLEKERFAFIKGHPKMLGSPYHFAQYGEDGAWISELLPHLARSSTRSASLRSMYTDQFNHAPAQLFLYTGSARLGRPSMGSWVTYGLGSENQDLPGFVVLVSGNKTPDAGKSVWGSGFLPTVYQGCSAGRGRSGAVPLEPERAWTGQARRRSLDALKDLNDMQAEKEGDPETLTRIAQYELAFRMQMSVPEVMDISRSPSTRSRCLRRRARRQASFANNCLLARRLVERGVRFVQLFDWGWDTTAPGRRRHRSPSCPKKCREIDRPVSAPDQGPRRSGPARRDAGGVGRRVRPHRDERGAQRLEVPGSRPPSALLHHLDGRRRLKRRRRRSARPTSWATTSIDAPDPRARPAGDDPAPARPRPRAADLPLPGPRLPADRRARRGETGDPGLRVQPAGRAARV